MSGRESDLVVGKSKQPLETDRQSKPGTETLSHPRYTSHYGVAAGYLPPNIEAVAEWQRQLAAEVAEATKRHGPLVDQPSVAALRALIASDRTIYTLVHQMIEQSKGLTGQSFEGPVVFAIANLDTLLAMMNHILVRAPRFEEIQSKRNFFPMSSLFVYMMYTPAGFEAFKNEKFNGAIRIVLQAWCNYLESAASLNVINKQDGWLSPPAAKLMDLADFVIPDPGRPDGGFSSFNAFFRREIKLEKRPLSGPNDPKVIVSANDGTVWRISRNVQRKAEFWLKDQPYSLENMLNGHFVDRFEKGDVFQAFLSGANYHRWRAPVSGKIVRQELVEGLMFSEVHAEGFDPNAGTTSQGYEASVNTRALVFIEADDPQIGLVCVMPIGITEISSITLSRDIDKNPRVEKGDELGWFSYGGSTLCLVFQPGAIKEFRWPWPPQDPQDPPTIEVRDGSPSPTDMAH